MKRTLSFMVMAFALLLTQCRKPEVKFPTPSSAEGVTVSMTVTAGPGSKTDITTEGAITWSEGDKLYVGDGSKYVGCLELVNGGSATGTFRGNVTLTGISEGTQQTFHFFYLGSDNSVAPNVGDETVSVSFATQEIYADANNKLVNASAHHIGYGSAKGTVTDGVVTGINVTLVSKVALARFSFKKNSTDYTEALILGGANIYNSMTIGFGGTFEGTSGSTKGGIRLTGSHRERYVMLVPPADVAAETLNFDGGAGTTILENGIEANKFYGKNEAIPVTINAYVDLGLPSGLLWATCNLGASKPEDYGDYYAWGETAPYIKNGKWCAHPSHNASIDFDTEVGYKWQNYLDGEHTSWNISYEWNPAPYGSGTTLTSDYDAATTNWGSGWRMPTTEEWQSLYDNNTFEWLDAGANSANVPSFTAVAAGYLVVKGKESSLDAKVYMFLPAAGLRDNTILDWAGEFGLFWSSSLSTDYPNSATFMSFDSSHFYKGLSTRYYGYVVRPVRGGATPEPPATPKFSVGSGTTVEFSPGNLYYNGANDSHKMNGDLPSGWNFYEHQWDCYPSETSSVTESMEISLFTWGYGDAWSTVYNAITYQTGDGVTMKDWGSVAIGSDPADTWRTLRNDEWEYLLNTRTTSVSGIASNARYAEVKVNGVCGMMLFPDTFTWPSDVTSKPSKFNASSSEWNDVNYSTADFGKLESSGAVFLPAASFRIGTVVSNVATGGAYWSSTPDNKDCAYSVSFDSSDVGTISTLRSIGNSVRLVR